MHCLQCGCSFQEKPSHVGKRKYCSVDCRAKAQDSQHQVHMTETDAAWLAGFIDGEGTITLAKRRKGERVYFVPLLLAVNTDEAAIMHVLKLTGLGIIYRNQKPFKKEWNQVYRYQATNQKALAILRKIRTHLRIKQELADILLHMPRMISHRFDPMIYAAQYSAWERIHHLNHRGVRHLL